MSLQPWRRLDNWSRVVFAAARLVNGVRLVRGADTDRGTWMLAYIAVVEVPRVRPRSSGRTASAP